MVVSLLIFLLITCNLYYAVLYSEYVITIHRGDFNYKILQPLSPAMDYRDCLHFNNRQLPKDYLYFI